MEKKCGIYCIENTIDHKKYIGLSRDIQRRWLEHCSELKRGVHDNIYLQRAWDKYGEAVFEFCILEECREEELSEREKYYISSLNSLSHDHGYNLTLGGENASTTNKRVIDYRTGRIYHSVRQAALDYNKAELTIINWCRQRKYIMYYDEWKQLSQDEQAQVQRFDWETFDHERFSQRTLNNITPETLDKLSKASKGKNNPRAFAIYCPELDESFWGAQEATMKYGVNAGSISSCLRGKLQSAGKHPVTGEKLTWVKV